MSSVKKVQRFTTRYLSIFLLLSGSALMAADYSFHSTDGAIAKLPVPKGWQFQYQQAVDACVMSNGVNHQVIVTFAPKMDPTRYLQLLLTELDADQYQSQIKVMVMAGKQVGSVQVRAQANEWILAIPQQDAMLFVHGQSTAELAELAPMIRQIVQHTRLAPARHTKDVSGHYQIRATSSTDFMGGGVYSEDFVTLHTDGSLTDSGFISGTDTASSTLSRWSDTQVHWEQRGNRLILFAPPNTFNNYLLKTFGNGLELYDQDNQQVLWVRR